MCIDLCTYQHEQVDDAFSFFLSKSYIDPCVNSLVKYAHERALWGGNQFCVRNWLSKREDWLWSGSGNKRVTSFFNILVRAQAVRIRCCTRCTTILGRF